MTTPSVAGNSSSGRRRRALFGCALAVNLAVLYWPRTVDGAGLPHLDKAVHLVVFAAVAWSGIHASLPARWLLPILALHAGTSEIVQARLLPGRSGSWADAAADVVGLLVGAAIARASWRSERVRVERQG